MTAAFTLEEQIEICYVQRDFVRSIETCGVSFDTPEKPRSQRGSSRQKSRGKRRPGRTPSHKTATRLLRGNVAVAKTRAEEAWEKVLRAETPGDPHPFFWEGDRSPIVDHPSWGGRWWHDCACREANTVPAVAEALVIAAFGWRERRLQELTAIVSS